MTTVDITAFVAKFMELDFRRSSTDEELLYVQFQDLFSFEKISVRFFPQKVSIVFQAALGSEPYLINGQPFVHSDHVRSVHNTHDIETFLNGLSKAMTKTGYYLNNSAPYYLNYRMLTLPQDATSIPKIAVTATHTGFTDTTVGILIVGPMLPLVRYLVLESVMSMIFMFPTLATLKYQDKDSVVLFSEDVAICSSDRDFTAFSFPAFNAGPCAENAETFEEALVAATAQAKSDNRRRRALTAKWKESETVRDMPFDKWYKEGGVTDTRKLEKLQQLVLKMHARQQKYKHAALYMATYNRSGTLPGHLADATFFNLKNFATHVENSKDFDKARRDERVPTTPAFARLPSCGKYALRQTGPTCWLTASLNLFLCTRVLRNLAEGAMPKLSTAVQGNVKQDSFERLLLAALDLLPQSEHPEYRSQQSIKDALRYVETILKNYTGNQPEKAIAPLLQAINLDTTFASPNTTWWTSNASAVILLCRHVSAPFDITKGNYVLVGAVLTHKVEGRETHDDMGKAMPSTHAVTGLLCVEDNKEWIIDPNYIAKQKESGISWTDGTYNGGDLWLNASLVYLRKDIVDTYGGPEKVENTLSPFSATKTPQTEISVPSLGPESLRSTSRRTADTDARAKSSAMSGRVLFGTPSGTPQPLLFNSAQTRASRSGPIYTDTTPAGKLQYTPATRTTGTLAQRLLPPSSAATPAAVLADYATAKRGLPPSSARSLAPRALPLATPAGQTPATVSVRQTGTDSGRQGYAGPPAMPRRRTLFSETTS